MDYMMLISVTAAALALYLYYRYTVLKSSGQLTAAETAKKRAMLAGVAAAVVGLLAWRRRSMTMTVRAEAGQYNFENNY